MNPETPDTLRKQIRLLTKTGLPYHWLDALDAHAAAWEAEQEARYHNTAMREAAIKDLQAEIDSYRKDLRLPPVTWTVATRKEIP